jgi:hypothetical protein
MIRGGGMLINQEIHPKGDESGVLQEEGQFTWFVQGMRMNRGRNVMLFVLMEQYTCVPMKYYFH